MATSLRVLYVGMMGDFSRLPLARLLADGVHQVVGVLVPAAARGAAMQPVPPAPAVSALPLLTPRVSESIITLAWEHGIPVWSVGGLSSTAVRQSLTALNLDVALVACFPRLIPPDLLAMPRHGWLNLHPSPLPALRGPEPLFWTFRMGLRDTAVTLHWLDEGLDTGDIARQTPLALPDGISGPAADRLCAQLGGELMAQTLAALAAGTQPRRAQPPGGSYQPSPTTDDFALDTAWPARRAFNFMRGTAVWGQPYRVEVAEQVVWLATAVSFDADEVLARPLLLTGDVAAIQFTPGVLRARLAGGV